MELQTHRTLTNSFEHTAQEWVSPQHQRSGKESSWTMLSLTAILQTANHLWHKWPNKASQLGNLHQWDQSASWPKQWSKRQHETWTDKQGAMAQLTLYHYMGSAALQMLYVGSPQEWWHQWIYSWLLLVRSPPERITKWHPSPAEPGSMTNNQAQGQVQAQDQDSNLKTLPLASILENLG